MGSIYAFGPFRLEIAERRLLRDGTVVPLRAKDVNGFLPVALDATAGLTIPGGIVIRSDGEPNRAAMLTGAPFDVQYVVTNPGDSAVAASEAELVPGEALNRPPPERVSDHGRVEQQASFLRRECIEPR